MSIIQLTTKIKATRPGDTIELTYREVAAAALMDLQHKAGQTPVTATPLQIAAYVTNLEKEFHVELELCRPDMVYTGLRLNPDGTNPWHKLENEFSV